MKIDITTGQTPQQRLLAIRAAVHEHVAGLVAMKREVYAIETDMIATVKRDESILGHVALLGQVALNLQADAQHITDLLRKMVTGPFPDDVRHTAAISVKGVLLAALRVDPKDMGDTIVEEIKP